MPAFVYVRNCILSSTDRQTDEELFPVWATCLGGSQVFFLFACVRSRKKLQIL